ncbi:ribosome biogenesis GTPase Der [Bulleidia extructa W1219]|jgi:ribosome-associated GTPase EngA|uniref:GTPase Der n=1 Tax=Bulleidia extructa W1219 TaxID=679192 RepID=D2MQC1_9FIRM|nr:ribosome biogenesis GTPase Der [Bulleidia extructa]EFC05190.1 ribosome biogenesis GTPase Der [Bulleidia extructa W1219]
MKEMVVAIVGRPNVGKSTIFNRLVGERMSIVEDIPGVTRDRLYGSAEWAGNSFRVIDTGGIQLANQPFQTEIRAQVDIAMEEADVILMVCDGQMGVMEDDRFIAGLLQKNKKPVVLAVNRIDDQSRMVNIYEFYELGLGDPMACSGIHGVGVGDVLDRCFELMPKRMDIPETKGVKMAVIGEPNVGKSSLVNAILNEERAIVSNIQGTTRDAIDTPFTHEGKPYIIVDTAGIRKRGKIYESIEKYSVLRAMRAIERCDVVLFVMDGEAGIREQDKHVAGYAVEMNKPIIIVVNKWDIVEKDDRTMNEFTQKVRDHFLYLSYAPIVFVSAKTHQRVNRILPIVDMILENAKRRIPTNVLNEVVGDAQITTPSPTHNGKRFRIYYATQVGIQPPTFMLSCNDPKLLHFSYERFLENTLRNAFPLEGTPIRIIARKKVSE